MAEYFQTGLESMGLKLFVKERVSCFFLYYLYSLFCYLSCSFGKCLFQKVRLPTVTTIVAPHGYNWKEITNYIMKTHNIEISGGLGPSIGLVRKDD